MKIQAKQFKKLKEQDIELAPGINLLVGANGSGKSSLLEFIFSNDRLGMNRIAYSSGINESYSKIYSPILKEKYKKYKNTFFSFGKSQALPSLNSFCIYLDKQWAPFLIIAALFLKNPEDSICASWAKKLGLKVFNLKFTLAFNHHYRKKIQLSVEKSEQGQSYLGFQNSRIHRFVSKISGGIDNIGTQSFEYLSIGNEETYSKNGTLSKEIDDYLFKNNILTDDDLLSNSNPKQFSLSQQKELQIVNFFSLLQALAFGSKPVLDLKSSSIVFANLEGNKFDMADLSDGEFQLLTTSALIDLFAGEASILLLDEIDAHIHPSVIGQIWKMLEPLKTIILTSSHNMMSLSLTDINRIQFLEDGTILSEFKRKKGVIDSLYGAYFSTPVANSLFYSCKNLFVLDGLADWEIFKALCIKTGKNFDCIESNSVYISKSSGSSRINGLDDLLSPKMDWITSFVHALQNLDFDKDKINLKNFIIISDRDEVDSERNVDLWYRKESVSGPKGYRAKIHKFIWNRRCIENYLLSKSARKEFASKITEIVMRDEWKVTKENLVADIDRFQSSYIGNLKNVGDLFTDSEMYNNQSVCIVNCKKVIHSFVFDNNGLNSKKLHDYIEKMNITDVDPYLIRVFDKIALEISL